LEDEISQKMIETMGVPLASTGVNESGNKNTSTLVRRKSRPAPQPPSTVASRNLSHPVEVLLGELAIRNPTELVIGIAKTVATQWRHKPQNLLRPGVCYEAQVSGRSIFNCLKDQKGNFSRVFTYFWLSIWVRHW
jgi:tRNA A37 threonylcarbamoyladenosine synthetase subunit TsaC/SUA5/YrdC